MNCVRMTHACSAANAQQNSNVTAGDSHHNPLDPVRIKSSKKLMAGRMFYILRKLWKGRQSLLKISMMDKELIYNSIADNI